MPLVRIEGRRNIRHEVDVVALTERVERREGDAFVEPVAADEQRRPARTGEREAERRFAKGFPALGDCRCVDWTNCVGHLARLLLCGRA